MKTLFQLLCLYKGYTYDAKVVKGHLKFTVIRRYNSFYRSWYFKGNPNYWTVIRGLLRNPL